MTRPNGKYIFIELLRRERPNQVTSDHGWLKQDSPSQNVKKLLSKTIREISQLNSGSLPIVKILKECTQPIQSRHTLHAWYYSEKSQDLFNRTTDGIYRFLYEEQGFQIKINLVTKEICMKLPNDCTSITIEDGKGKIDPEFQICIEVSSSEITSKQYINSFPSWQQKLISKFKESTTVDPLLNFIQLKQPIIKTSDRSKSKNKFRGSLDYFR